MKLLALALYALLPFAPTTPARPQDELPELPDLKEELDRSIHWMRSKQHAPTGAYGTGVETTAWVVRAMAASPRRYQISDGPFVAGAVDYLLAHQAADGSIADAGASDEARMKQTRVATAALALVVDPGTRNGFNRAIAWLTTHGVDDPAAGEAPLETDKVKAAARVVELLARRNDDGSWEGEGGSVLATARNAYEIASCAGMLKPPKAAHDVHALPAFTAADAAAADAAIQKGARYLLSVAKDGKWGPPDRADAGITAMAIGALQAWPQPRPADVQKVIDDGLLWLASLQKEDGGIHQGMLANYVTSAAILALARSDSPKYGPYIAKARDYLVVLQSDEGEGYTPDHHYYGGIGYGGDERPDLSNLQMALEALSVSGLDKDHEAWDKALRFLQRCQNRSESNPLNLIVGSDVIVSGDDGGSGYMPGDSPAGYVTLPDGKKVPRSYGSMSYALLKGYVLAGLPKEDPRMQACFDWLQKNYTLDVNPGFEFAKDPSEAYQGLFYYFHVMARALDLYGVDAVVDRDGKAHNWRSELCGRLVAIQSKIDGSWVNSNAARWWEGNPVLATSYALLTLGEARP